MYRAMDPAAREQGLREIAKQLRILERYAKAEPYLAGPSETAGKQLTLPVRLSPELTQPPPPFPVSEIRGPAAYPSLPASRSSGRCFM